MKYFVATVLSIMLVLGAIYFLRLYKISAPTPEQAVTRHFARITKNSPQALQSITFVSETAGEGREETRLLLFHATEKPSEIYMVGYAVTGKTIFGWAVQSAQITGRAPTPTDLLVQVTGWDGKPLVFGQVFLDGAASVEARFSPGTGPASVTGELVDGQFVLFGSQYQELLELHILDSQGRPLRQLTTEELQNLTN